MDYANSDSVVALVELCFLHELHKPHGSHDGNLITIKESEPARVVDVVVNDPISVTVERAHADTGVRDDVVRKGRWWVLRCLDVVCTTVVIQSPGSAEGCVDCVDGQQRTEVGAESFESDGTYAVGAVDSELGDLRPV